MGFLTKNQKMVHTNLLPKGQIRKSSGASSKWYFWPVPAATLIKKLFRFAPAASGVITMVGGSSLLEIRERKSLS